MTAQERTRCDRKKKAEALWRQGMVVKGIAVELGVCERAVYNYLSEIKPAVKRKNVGKATCPYGDDCFNCPAPDCMLKPELAARVNKLEYERMRCSAEVENAND